MKATRNHVCRRCGIDVPSALGLCRDCQDVTGEKLSPEVRPGAPRVAELPEITLDHLRGRTTLPVWHATEPSVAALFRLSRSGAYGAAERGDFPTIRLGRRYVVPVPALLRMLGADTGEVKRSADV